MRVIESVTTGDLQQRLDRDDGLHLLNVQTNGSFVGELIPGSRRIPLDVIEHGTQTLPKDTEIVTYCGGPECSQSREAAGRLSAIGYTNVRVYVDGLAGWKASGGAVVRPQPLYAA